MLIWYRETSRATQCASSAAEQEHMFPRAPACWSAFIRSTASETYEQEEEPD